MASGMGKAAKILAWLADGARSATTSEAVLAELCEGLSTIGVPLSRVAVFVRTLNPNNIGRRFIWRHDGGPVEILDGDFDLFNRDEYLDNPIAVVQREGRSIRRRLIDPNSPMDYPVLQEFKAGGITDYLASPLVSTDGLIHVATWSTTDPNGFSDEHIRILESVVPLLARVAEIRALRRTVVTLLDTYVGHQSGERILAGRIRRGDSEMIRAVIWLSDLRGFTGLTDRLPGATVIAMLNRYFDCQIPPILERGGEVLKLIGDGLLAIFPVASEAAEAGVCNQALEAARDFRRRVAGTQGSGRRRQCRAPALRPGAAYRRTALRQYRRRQPPRLHQHRSRHQSGRAAGKGERRARPLRGGLGRIRPLLPGPAGTARRFRAQGLCPARDRLQPAGRTSGRGGRDLR